MAHETLSFDLKWIGGATPDFSGLGISADDMLQGLLYQPGASVLAPGASGREYFYYFPTLFYRDPQLPGLEYVKNGAGAYELSRVLPQVTMGSGRDYARLEDAPSGNARFVVVDHGSEYSAGQHTWPFGHVWVATEGAGGYEFKQISDVRGFYHAVDTGDVNGDGLTDIVATHMGVKSGGAEQSLHAWIQQKDGSFKQDKGFASSILSTWGSGAVAVGDVNGDGADDIIQANYLSHGYDPAWGSLRVLSRDSAGAYRPIYELSEHGLFETMGASRIVPFDYNQDGHLDLVVALEGTYEQTQDGALGLEIYRNNGHGQFDRVTPEIMPVHAWRDSDMQFREFEVVDFDSDGLPDIVLNGWQGGDLRGESGLEWNLSAQMFRNVGGEKFVRLDSIATTGLELPQFGNWENTGKIVEFGRVNTWQKDGLEIVLMQRDGTPIAVNVHAAYRDASEALTVGGKGTVVNGFGGDDQFTITGTGVDVDGGSGLDTAIYHSSLTDFSVSSSGSTLWISGGDAADTFRNVELFQFQDAVMSAPELAGMHNPGAIFRFYNESTGNHFYTASAAEAGGLVRQAGDFAYEGIAFNQAPPSDAGTVEVFRFYNQDTRAHFYTASAAERDHVMENYHHFIFEGTAYHAHAAEAPGTTALYRFFNNDTGSHFYTASKEEMEHVQVNLAGVYSYEGVAYYVDAA